VGPMYVDAWASGSGEALDRLQGALTPGAFYNTWVDDKITANIKELSSTFDRDARAKQYGELQQYMFDNPPFVYLYRPTIYEAYSTKVTGYAPTLPEVFDLSPVSVAK